MRKAGVFATALAAMALTGCLSFGTVPMTEAPEPKVRWGYSVEHPLPMASIQASYAFLDRLRTAEGKPVRYHRVGSTLAPREARREQGGKGILDIYELSDDTGATVRLWLNPYAGHTSQEPPEGFRFSEPKTAPGQG